VTKLLPRDILIIFGRGTRFRMPKALFGNSWAVAKEQAARRRNIPLRMSEKRPFLVVLSAFFITESFFRRVLVSMGKEGSDPYSISREIRNW
jgi:hypothetical protein